MTANANNDDSLHARRLCALYDDERLDAADDHGPDGHSASPETLDGPLSDACVARWRGYCLTSAVLRDELASGATGRLDLAARVRAQLEAERGRGESFDDAGDPGATVPPAWRPWRAADGRTRFRPGRWRYAGAHGRRSGAAAMGAAALGAAAIGVAIGLTSGQEQGVDRAGADVGAPTLLAEPTASGAAAIDDSAAVAAAIATGVVASTRRTVPRVEGAVATVASGQLPYFFAHASATSAAFRPGSMTLMPIASTDLADGRAQPVRH